MNNKLYVVSKEIYKEMLEAYPINRYEMTCDTTLIPDYGYDVDSKEGRIIEDRVNFLINRGI